MKRILTSNLSPHSRACVPTALAVILERPYEEVNNWLEVRKYRRHDNSGTFTGQINMSEIGLNRFRTDLQGKSVNQFVSRNLQGTFLVRVNKHCLAVKNGITFDTGNSEKRRVLEVWEKVDIKLPDDWDWAQDVYKRKAQYEQEKLNKEKKAKQRKEYYKKVKKAIKVKKNTAGYKLDQLLKRKKSWISKLKRARTTLKTIERKIKYYQRKNTQS